MVLWRVFRWAHLVWVTVLTCLTLWCCVQTAQFVYDTVYPSKATLTAVGSNSRTSSRSRNGSSVQRTKPATLTLILTLLSTVLLELSLMCYTVGYMVILSESGWTRKRSDTKSSKYWIMYVCSGVFQYYGYSSQLWVFFRRIEFTFRDSPYMMTAWQMRVFYSCLIVYISLPTAWFLAYLISGHFLIPDSAIGLSSLVYLCLSVWLCRLFYKSMISLILMSDEDTNTTLSSTDRSILNVALKLTITPMTALLSTIMVEISFFICYPILSAFGDDSERIGRAIFAWVFTLDSFINVLCLLCSLAKSQAYYDWVFGRVHQYFWERIIASMDHGSDQV